ncbi:MAG: DPP IV N-terminal domain-containing protein, partial [Vicinamibacterales bacterium]|nr:DPP IV N-terminal domain-containing protein [Vicinamibacterales bacterium]
MFVLLLTVPLLVSAPVAFTQQASPAPTGVSAAPVGLPPELDDRLRAMFERNEYPAESMGPMAWLDGGRRYTSIARGASRDILAFDTATGTQEILVPASTLVPPGRSEALSIADYAWSVDRTKLLVFTNTRRVWRQHTRGDYWVLDRSSGALTKLGGDAPEASLMFAKFSPDGRQVAYVRAQNVYVEDLSGGSIRAITTDGGGDLINGTSDWVNEEEFSIRDGFRWSPDGRL